MFFVSEEFLRKYEAGEAFGSTLDQVTKPGESLFPDAHGTGGERKSKAERAEEARQRTRSEE
ncbi:MAG: hypothetical protein C4290_10160 [Chloroflexota bacterium]